MPTYNSAQFLNEAVESILMQTFQDFEFIIIDDASIDDTWSRLKVYALRDRRIHLFRNEKNCGIAQTRNTGLLHARGIYYAPMDHDDISHPQRLQKEIEFLETHPTSAVVGCQVSVIDGQGKIIGRRKYPCSSEEIKKSLSIASPFCNPAVLIRMSTLEKNGYLDTCYPGCEDYDLWLSLGRCCDLANLPDCLFSYRVTDTQVKSKQTKKMLRYTLQIKKKWIFKKPYRSIKSQLIWSLQWALLVMPEQLIVRLFKKIYYEKQI